MKEYHWRALGAVLAGTAVAMGAFGAHGLHDKLELADQFDTWETAVRYQLWHGLALILYALSRRQDGRIPSAIGWCFFLGSVCFSGSLYAIALGAPTSYLWPVTPLGGLLLIVGWGLFALSAIRPGKVR